MSSLSKDQIGEALLIVAIILMGVGATLIILHTSKETGAYISMSGGVLGMISGLMKRGTLDGGSTCSD